MASTLNESVVNRPMKTEQTTVELTARQQELLLKGLRFVRSNVALEMQIPTDETDASRREQYAELDDLVSKLSDGHAPRLPR